MEKHSQRHDFLKGSNVSGNNSKQEFTVQIIPSWKLLHSKLNNYQGAKTADSSKDYLFSYWSDGELQLRIHEELKKIEFHKKNNPLDGQME